ncbi:hypothetical protein ACFWY6_44805 [Streptomyces sp. NPDC059037]|uniref:hypothetical protein n=1 Tax=Streptomyces sp. NPDC059037 TaxID=3346710 RepID=UPI00367947E5
MAEQRMRIVEQDLGPWVVEMEWPEGQTQGGPGVLVVRPADPESYPPGGISSTVLRDIDFRDALRTLRRQVQFSDRWESRQPEYTSKDLRESLAAGVSDKYLSQLASVYITVVERGQSGPLVHLAEMIGKSASTIKGHLWQARKRGLMEGSPGRAGGLLTEKAKEALKGKST